MLLIDERPEQRMQRSRQGERRTILLLHTISARPSKTPRVVGSTLGVYSFGLILFLQEQIKDIIIINSCSWIE